MTIVYALCARGKTVLAEFTATSGNFPTVTRVLLSKIPPQDGKMSYVYDKYVFHYVVDAGITYLCMANDNRKQRVPFAFLEDIRRRFRSQFGDAIHSAIAFSFNEEFAPTLQGQMAFYNSDPSSDQIGQVKSQLEDVKGVMVENIEKVLERGEKIELLVDKTDRLNQTAFKFEKTSKQLKNAMFWKTVRMYAMAAGVVVLLGLFVAASACGGVTFEKCRSDDDN
mmetsp:Transcript_32402/g.74958  ORF Transcript_32402/g.74958 Transcript_32402/m.74958 type:complete len:224 (+) Transcript_32402:102-773(+)